ncbi:HpcH/HpaI aldolase family protein [Methylobrevis albus]|uniref:Hpch/hpai aldolase n=1 Tax=Methylobrevis albus TaxID=2793297 RepID=A0A931MX55_9HYPH|nr:aldolase/citrate lyase family protein [Methylobrevis albus]MBH0238493.1 hpch/hpai aldolase [Methylobrevis albus]
MTPAVPARTLKQKFAADGHAFGPMVIEFFTPGMAAIAAAAGADFVLYDMEHSGAEIGDIKEQCAAARGLGIAPLVRVPSGEYHFVARALDAGAEGIMVPMVESAAHAAEIVSFAHYPPKGRRGAAFGVAHDGYRGGDPVAKIAAANGRTLIIPQIETKTGLEAVEDIAAVDGVDIVWVGHFDLTNFLGIPAAFDHPDYEAALARVLAAADANGKPAGFMAADEAWAEAYYRRGFRAIAYGLDHLLFQKALAGGLSLLNGLAAATPARG